MKSKKTAKSESSEKLALFVAEAADKKKAKDIELFDVRNLTSITDYFVLCTGESKPQLKAIVESISEDLKHEVKRKKIIRSKQMIDSGWVVLDLGSVIVHVMDEEARNFYNLEELWGKASIIYHE